MNAVDIAGDLWLLLAAYGLNLAVGHAGQPVLGQGAFVAVGAYGVLLLDDLPLGLAVALAVGIASFAGWAIGYGAARLRGPFLALGTWSGAWLVAAILAGFPGVFGGEQGLVRSAPAVLESRWLGLRWTVTPRWHVVLATVACLAAAAGTAWLRRCPVGLDLAALRDGPEAAASVGVRVPSLRRGMLAASSALGALSGAGTAVLLGVVAPGDVSPLLSIQLFAAVLLGGTASVVGPVVGVAVLIALPTLADALSEVSGVAGDRARGLLTAVLLVAALTVREPVARRLRRLRTWMGPPDWGIFSATQHRGSSPIRRANPAGVTSTPPAGVVLEARDLVRRYGGVRALDGIDLDLRAGEIHALIGPNGSGKTTTLRLLAGAIRSDAGTVRLLDTDVTGLGQATRVRAGVARTFQHTVLFPGLSVAAHVAVGARATERPGALRALLRTPSARAAHAAAGGHVASALGDTGLASQAEALPATLTYGEQRLLQVARAAATGARVLLLDEPAAGMSATELRRLATAVRRLAANGVAVLIVEHNVRFVSHVADRITVLSEGRVLATGRPEDIRADPAVRRVYLGEDVA